MPVALYTLADLRSIVYQRVENNQELFPESSVDAAINEAIKVVNLFTGFYQGTVEMLSVAGQLKYDIPAGLLYPQRLQFNGVNLDPIAINQIGKDYRNWATMNTDKDGPVARWIPIGINYFCLNPIDQEGGQTIYVTGVLEPPVLADADETMVLEDEYVTLIAEYGGMKLPQREGGAPATQAMALLPNFWRILKSLTNFRQVTMPKYFVQAGSPVNEGNTR